MSQQLVSTNLRAEDLIMDIRGGGNDSRYYCLPPFRGSTDGVEKTGRGFPFYLVSQGHVVGIFDNWHETKASISGFPDNSYRGYNTVEECIEGWQALCRWGIHPHPVDPANAVNTSPRKRAKASAAPEQKVYDLKVLYTPQRSPAAPPRSPAAPPRPQKAGRHEAGDQDFVNFAIRGAGVVSSSAYVIFLSSSSLAHDLRTRARTEQRYREMQLRGEEPELLVTRSLEAATSFALEEPEFI
ncbi:hypothetical protein DFH08DRAFT_802222 [Mycena albidolilacea]|uniref:Ribonuclease H1 N-terminal domain-containing protein n=1 Tax=Mycena albidolilacea TaxID=1033008 RepID=A0AAD7EY18_9AGAR|nr:hypothetical protein DFH08DRAFT_802222 [Mycena albidolilacea]